MKLTKSKIYGEWRILHVLNDDGESVQIPLSSKEAIELCLMLFDTLWTMMGPTDFAKSRKGRK